MAVHGGDFNILGPTSKEAGSEQPDEMLAEAERIRRSHPDRERRPGLWRRLRAKFARWH